MGKYFCWRKLCKDIDSTSELISELEFLGFKYTVDVTGNYGGYIELGSTLVDNPKIIELTNYEWTGYFDGSSGIYHLLFKNQGDAVAIKLRWI